VRKGLSEREGAKGDLRKKYKLLRPRFDVKFAAPRTFHVIASEEYGRPRAVPMPELTIAAAGAIFLATYTVVAVGKLPLYRIDRAGAALLGGS
jgi:hypothetical protein